MRFKSRLSVFLVGPLLLSSGCDCSGPQPRVLDGGAGPGSIVCTPDSVPPSNDLFWQTGEPATVAETQSAVWVATSTDPECALVQPAGLPPKLTWEAGPAGPQCDRAFVDGEGNLAVWQTIPDNVTSFFRPDGSAGKVITDGDTTHLWLAPRREGFWMLSTGDWHTRDCQFLNSLGPDGSRVGARWVQRLGLKRNPMGGFVEIRGLRDEMASPPYLAEEVRWVGEDLEPLGEWHRVLTWYTDQGAPNIQLEMIVDREGKALVLSYAYPKSFGPPAPPSTWKFMARWADKNGPLGEVFEPPAPTTIPVEGYPSFRGWGNLVRLAGGGVAAYRAPSAPLDPPGSTTSPSGWYAAYWSSESQARSAPEWLGQYDGSLQLLEGGFAYAATRRDLSTCARTALLIASSGRTCFALPLQGSNECAMNDTFWPDGTLVAQSSCQLSWWPGLAQLSH